MVIHHFSTLWFKVKVPACLSIVLWLSRIILTTAFLLVFTEAAHADIVYESGFSITITEVRSLTLDSDNALLNPGATAVLSGWMTEKTWDVNICANVDWVLKIRGTSSTWEGPWPKPVGDIYCAYAGSEYMPLDTAPIEIYRGGPADHESYPINFRIALDPLLDIPGDYYYSYIVFELESP